MGKFRKNVLSVLQKQWMDPIGFERLMNMFLLRQVHIFSAVPNHSRSESSDQVEVFVYFLNLPFLVHTKRRAVWFVELFYFIFFVNDIIIIIIVVWYCFLSIFQVLYILKWSDLLLVSTAGSDFWRTRVVVRDNQFIWRSPRLSWRNSHPLTRRGKHGLSARLVYIPDSLPRISDAYHRQCWVSTQVIAGIVAGYGE